MLKLTFSNKWQQSSTPPFSTFEKGIITLSMKESLKSTIGCHRYGLESAVVLQTICRLEVLND
jgi:hypothetical protein